MSYASDTPFIAEAFSRAGHMKRQPIPAALAVASRGAAEPDMLLLHSTERASRCYDEGLLFIDGINIGFFQAG